LGGNNSKSPGITGIIYITCGMEQNARVGQGIIGLIFDLPPEIILGGDQLYSQAKQYGANRFQVVSGSGLSRLILECQGTGYSIERI
jgi:hypothetical protein